eukprot:scaffold1446_cov391-Prasinococcus_capsulatus_cf.AAC.7
MASPQISCTRVTQFVQEVESKPVLSKAWKSESLLSTPSHGNLLIKGIPGSPDKHNTGICWSMPSGNSPEAVQYVSQTNQ